jgi:hypothetical protein
MPCALSKEGPRSTDSKPFESGLRGSSPSTRIIGMVTTVVGYSLLTKAKSFSYLLKEPEDSNLLHRSKMNRYKGLSPPERDGVHLALPHEG